MINEAIYTLYEGVGSVEAIDTAMKLGANHPMGSDASSEQKILVVMEALRGDYTSAASMALSSQFYLWNKESLEVSKIYLPCDTIRAKYFCNRLVETRLI